MRSGRPHPIAIATIAAFALAACSDGGSILEAGNDGTTSTVPTVSTESTVPGQTTVPPTTTTTPLDQLPPCPTDALDTAGGPVEITFWHGLSGQSNDALTAITAEYNAGQDRVRVDLQNQGGYEQNITKYLQSSPASRPDLAQFPEYVTQSTRDTGTMIPVAACAESDGYDLSTFLPRAIGQYTTEQILWSMPFNISDPVLFFLKPTLVAAGLDPDDPPVSLEELRADCEAIVSSGAAPYCIALDSGSDSGGGWFLEQWIARTGQFYANNDNGRSAPATQVLFDGPAGIELMTFLQQLVADGLGVNVGDNASGQDNFLKLAGTEPAAMTIGTSAALGQVLDVLGSGVIPGITIDDVGIGPMPGPSETAGALVGGNSLWIVDGKGDAVTAAVWDYVKFLVSAQTQSAFAVATGYVPVRTDALELDPVKSTYAADPRFKVAYDQLLASVDSPSSIGPLLGPQREIRVIAAGMVADVFGGADVAAALAAGAAEANALLADYAARNP